MTPKSVSETFIQWMEDSGYGHFGTDIFLNQIPDAAPDNAWWIVNGGGNIRSNLITAQNIKRYTFDVYCRNVSGEALEQNTFRLENDLNANDCSAIGDLELYNVECTMAADRDRDAENRRQASITVTIEIYKTYVS